MPRFKYVAMDAKGKETEGVVEAETQSQEPLPPFAAEACFPPASPTRPAAVRRAPRAKRGLER